MAKARPSLEQQKAYSKAYDHLNKELFKNKLTVPMLVLSRNKNILRGYFSPDKWQDEEGNITHEIAINANLMSDIENGNILELFTVLAHEMIHLWQHDNGKPSHGGYHNKEWINKAEELGLKVTGSGYDVKTTMVKGGLLEEALATMPDDAVFPWITGELHIDSNGNASIVAKPDQRTKAAKKKAASKSGKRVKYVCPNCLTKVWGKADLRIECMDCKEKYQAI